ncbi:MAG: hypothetical protein ACUVQY_06010 [Thermoproteota archaeon]
MPKKEFSSVKPTKSIIFVALLWILQSVGRFVFGYLSAVTPGGLLDVKVAQITIQVIDAMFFLLGVLGFIAIVGLLMMRKWGSGQQFLLVFQQYSLIFGV